jgi:hypothetical protein
MNFLQAMAVEDRARPAQVTHTGRRQHTALYAVLDALKEEIANGAEFPDAVWKISQEFGVTSDALEVMYDESFED